MNLKCSLSNSDEPLTQIQECISLMSKIDEARLEKGDILNLDFSDVEWMLPCSALLLSNKILEACKIIDINILPPNKKEVYEYLSKIGFPLGCEVEGDTFLPISHFSNKGIYLAF